MKGKNRVLASALVWGVMSMQMATATSLSENNATKSVLFNVSHVKQDDNLNIRAGAGVGNEIVTTIPFDGGGIELLGDEVTLGETRWVLINWKGITGWVSKYYLVTEQGISAVALEKENPSVVKKSTEAKTTVDVVDDTSTEKVSIEKASIDSDNSANNTNTEVVASEAETTSSKSVEENNNSSTVANHSAELTEDVWVLRCGNKTPYWKVDVHPKWMDVLKGDYKADLQITKKKQDRNRWNAALKTIVHARNGRNNLQMTIKYAYSKRCYDTLSGLRVPYKVTTKFNGEELTGCCRAVKLESAEAKTTKISMK
ncbi:MAG: SH3 domain-containing protein [Thiotrichaceae bacterium]